MAEIKHRVGIKGSTEQIYSLLTTDTGLSRWWTSDTRGAGDVGSVIHFRFGQIEVKFEVIELIPERLVHWRHSGDMPPDWKGSKITFELEQQDKQAILLFSLLLQLKGDFGPVPVGLAISILLYYRQGHFY